MTTNGSYRLQPSVEGPAQGDDSNTAKAANVPSTGKPPVLIKSARPPGSSLSNANTLLSILYIIYYIFAHASCYTQLN